MSADAREAPYVALLGADQDAAFDGLYRLYSGRLKYMLRRWTKSAEDAEDIAQDAWCRAWQRRDRFVPGPGPFYAWLHGIALRMAHDRHRRVSRFPFDSVLWYRDAEINRGPAWVDLGRSEDALATLPATHSEAILLAASGCTMTEVAGALGVPRGTVLSRIFRGREQLARPLPRAANPPAPSRPAVQRVGTAPSPPA